VGGLSVAVEGRGGRFTIPKGQELMAGVFCLQAAKKGLSIVLAFIENSFLRQNNFLLISLLHYSDSRRFDLSVFKKSRATKQYEYLEISKDRADYS